MSPKKCSPRETAAPAARVSRVVDKARNEQQKAILLCDVARYTHVARSRALVAQSRKLMNASEKLRARTTKKL